MNAVDRTEQVRQYWEARPCGADAVPSIEGSPEYFQWITRTRYAREPFIRRYAQFDRWRNLDVLEVGIGVGTDAEQFARAGARFTGIDLTEHGIALARRRFDLAGLPGRLERGDAEQLAFDDAAFDFVYSWGVIHHSPNPEIAARELVRVCRPGGRVCCMVYTRHSLYVLQGRLVFGVLRGRPRRSPDEIASAHFESPGTRLYDEPQLRSLFAGLEKVHVSREVTPYDARIGRRLFLPRWCRGAIPRRFGYFMILEGVRGS